MIWPEALPYEFRRLWNCVTSLTLATPSKILSFANCWCVAMKFLVILIPSINIRFCISLIDLPKAYSIIMKRKGGIGSPCMIPWRMKNSLQISHLSKLRVFVLRCIQKPSWPIDCWSQKLELSCIKNAILHYHMPLICPILWSSQIYLYFEEYGRPLGKQSPYLILISLEQTLFVLLKW